MRSTRAVVGVALAVLMGAACGGSSSSSDNKYALTVDLAGAGTGKVTSTAGIDCGTTCSVKVSEPVTLTAAADAGSKFVGWHGACVGMQNPCVAKVTAAASVTASFTAGGSGLPVPNGGGKAAPSGTAGDLKVLDWAGFDAAITYTFDDALTSQTANYPALKATGVPMTFFVVPKMVEKNVEAWKQMRADGQEMGNHTYAHCNADMSGCAWGPAQTTQDLEVSENTKFIKETLGQEGVWTMASPNGDTKWDAYAKAAHLLVNRDVNPQGGVSFASPGKLERQYNLPSFFSGIEYGGSGYKTEWLDGSIDDTVKGKGWGIFLFHAIGNPYQIVKDADGKEQKMSLDDPTKPWVDPDAEGCCETPLESILGSIDHAQSVGDVWVGRMVDVAAYWIGQSIFGAVTPTTSGNKTTWQWTLPENFPTGKYLRVTVAGGKLSQGGQELAWDEHGYYEVALDKGELTLTDSSGSAQQQYDCTLVTGTSGSQYGNTGVGVWFEYTSADFLAAATAGDPYVASVDVFVPTSASEVPPDLKLTANRDGEASLFTSSAKVTKGSWQNVTWTISPDTASPYWSKLADKDIAAAFMFSTSAENQAVTFCFKNFTIANKAGAVADLKLNTGYVSLGAATYANGHM